MKKFITGLFCIISLISINSANAAMTKEANQLYFQACRYENQNNYEAAINAIKEALEKNGEEAILYVKLAGLYTDICDYENALGAYKAAIKLRPDDAFIYISMGNILQTLGD